MHKKIELKNKINVQSTTDIIRIFHSDWLYRENTTSKTEEFKNLTEFAEME